MCWYVKHRSRLATYRWLTPVTVYNVSWCWFIKHTQDLLIRTLEERRDSPVFPHHIQIRRTRELRIEGKPGARHQILYWRVVARSLTLLFWCTVTCRTARLMEVKYRRFMGLMNWNWFFSTASPCLMQWNTSRIAQTYALVVVANIQEGYVVQSFITTRNFEFCFKWLHYLWD